MRCPRVHPLVHPPLLLGLLLALAACDASAPRGGPPSASADGGGESRDAGHDEARDAAPHDTGVEGCALRCGPTATCCAAGEECLAARCVPACAGARCGADDLLCCSAGQLCVNDTCIEPGPPCAEPGECGEGLTCDPTVGRCLPVPDDAACRYVPPVGVFEPAPEWSWTEEHVQSIPLVVPLTDHDGDGDVDAEDGPDLVVTSFATTSERARLAAFDGRDGRLLWRSSPTIVLCGSVQPAAADLDGDGRVEIATVGAAADGSCGSGALQPVVLFDHRGVARWSSTEGVVTRHGALAVGDLDGDGFGEIVAAGAVFGHDGRLRFRRAELTGLLGPLAIDAPALADADGDGGLEIYTSAAAVDAAGALRWSGGPVPAGYAALADLSVTGPGPDLVAVNATTLALLDPLTGAVRWGPLRYEADALLAGPPTVADFDGDGEPEIGVAGENRYVVFDPALPPPHELWSVPSQDVTTGSAGSTVFDFDADGSAEVVVGDECHLRILRGADGAELWSTVNTSVTALEAPVVADVDLDGNAELVAVSNDIGRVSAMRCPGRSRPYAVGTRGVRVFGDRLDNWVPTRPVWHQHGYHIDDIEDSGRLPAPGGPPSWATHNSWRANRLADPDGATSAPNLVVRATEAEPSGCPVRALLRARVENRGAWGVPAGVTVAFRAGTPEAPGPLLAVGRTSRPLLAGTGEWVEAVAEGLPVALGESLRFHARVDDDGAGVGAHSECVEDDNTGAPVELRCMGPG